MKIRNAEEKDINGIMQVERDAFIECIREEESVFLERIQAFPGGFFVLTDDDNDCIAGYFSSELWESVPIDSHFFKLGHSAHEFHKDKGEVLYISSIGLRKEYLGKKLGDFLFNEAVKEICTHNLQVKQIVLLVNEVWMGARHIYTKAGFTEYDEIEGFFPALDGVNTKGILMRKSV